MGTLIKQNAPLEEYISNYSETTLKLIDFFKLYNVYQSPWFIASIIIFSINLVVCTFTRFSRRWKRISHTHVPDENALFKMENTFTVKKEKEDEALSIIMKKYRKVYEGEDGFILEKGSLSRYGVFFIHLSILIILIGSLIGLIWGYKGFLTLYKGEIKERFILKGKNHDERSFGFAVRCKDFKVSYYPNGLPKEYVTSLEILENNKVVMERDIKVNKPLNYKGIHFYQSSYGTTPTFLFKINGEYVHIKEHGEYEAEGFIMVPVRFEASIHNFGPGVQVAFLEDGEPKTAWFLRDIPKMKTKDLGGKKVILEDIKEETWTGLEITYDPGVGPVWCGFALMLIGLYMNFFMVSGRIYVRRGPEGLIVSGVGLRQKERFLLEFHNIKRRLNGTS